MRQRLDEAQRDAEAQREHLQDRGRLGLLRGAQGPGSILENGRLLAGDRGDVGAEVGGMIEVDRGEQRGREASHAGGVEAPAEPGLDHHHVDAGRLEVQQRGEREDLEEGQRSRQAGLVDRQHAIDEALHGVVRDRHTIDADALANSVQVGAGVEADLATVAQRVGAHRRGRALAVGAEHVDRRDARAG